MTGATLFSLNSEDHKKAEELSKMLKGALGNNSRKKIEIKKPKDLSFVNKFTGIKHISAEPKPASPQIEIRHVTETPEAIVEKVNSASNKIKVDAIEGLPTAKDMVEEMRKLKGNDRIDISNIRNGENLARFANGNFNMNDQRWHGGGDTVAAGTNITITTNSSGQKVISSTGGGTPGGVDTSLQYNNSGSFGGFGTFDGTYLNLPNGLAFRGQYTNIAHTAYINPDGSAVFGGGPLVITNAGVLTAANFSGTSSGTNTGDQDLSGLVPKTTTVNGHALSSNVTVTASDVGAPSGSGTSTGTNTGDQTNISGNAATVTTNANMTGAITSVGNASSLGSFTSAQLATALSNETGSGVAVFGTSPDFTTSATIGGVIIPTISSTNTLTNKRITRRLVNVTQSATPAINSDNTDVANILALAQSITSMTTNLTGTPVNGDLLEIRITDNGTARGITWGVKFASTTVTLPPTTVISTILRTFFEFNSAQNRYEIYLVA